MSKIHLQPGLMAGLLALGAWTSSVAGSAESNTFILAATRAVAPVKTSVTVEVNGPSVIVHTHYENVTDQAILIKRGSWGVDREHPGATNGAENEFSIYEKEDRVGLQFNGLVANYISPWGSEEFTPVTPGEVLTSSRRLGPITLGPLKEGYLYGFLPGTHEYEIVAQYILLEQKNTIKNCWTEATTFTFTLPQAKGKVE